MAIQIISGSYSGGPALKVIAGPFRSEASARKRAAKLGAEFIIYDAPSSFFEAAWHVAIPR